MNGQGAILVVDDERIHRRALGEMLGPLGYDIMEARDGQSMIEAIGFPPPDLILLDVIMPGDNGIELCRRLKKDTRTQTIPVIIITSLEDRRAKLEGLEAGAEDFFVKPVDKRKLTTRVKNLLKAKEYNDLIRSHKDNLGREIPTRTQELQATLIALKQANKTINQSYLDTIYRLAVAAEFKDQETGRHVRRMSAWVGIMDEKQLGIFSRDAGIYYGNAKRHRCKQAMGRYIQCH
jgi:putative two-component system response regulator